MYDPFEGPELKLARARRHIDEFEARVAAYRANRPFELQLWEGTRATRSAIRPREPVPRELPLIIGDAVHNVRASLDLLANDLIRVSTQTAPDARFPFCKEEKDHGEMERRGRFDRAPADIRAMVKDLKPWEGTLRAVHDLDIVDKHRMILPAFSAVSAGDRGSFSGLGSRMGYATIGIQAADDENPALERVHDRAAEDEINASFKLVFEIPDAFEPLSPDAEVSVALRDFADTVEGIVKTFKAHCL